MNFIDRLSWSGMCELRLPVPSAHRWRSPSLPPLELLLKVCYSDMPIRSYTISVVTLLIFLTPPLAHAQFPIGGGNPQRTGFVELAGPVTEPEVLWERSLGVSGSSNTQPLVDESGNIYVTGAPEGGLDRPKTEDPRGALVSLTPQGEERWRFDTLGIRLSPVMGGQHRS